MTVKTFTDLTGLKEENIEELKSIGIETVDDLKAAVNDDDKVKEIVKALSGVGPKTVDKWRSQFEG
jgi:large subunit ribosomal protein L32e